MDQSDPAIQASLNHNWKEAIKLNLQILKSQPDNVDALNRLGRAYLQSGFKTKAEASYKKVLRFDKYNTIAIKSLTLIKSFKIEHNKSPYPSASNFSQAFLEEPGTTKTISLIRLGDIKILSRLQPGDEVFLAPREHCVSVINHSGVYIGRLPDDLASRMRLFLKAGNKYQIWIKTVDVLTKSQAHQNIRIFIREISRGTKFSNNPSFPSSEKLTYAAFTPPELVHSEKPDVSTPEEDVEGFSTGDDRLDTDQETEPLTRSDTD